jgi:flavin-binding protein dodecin
VSVVSDAQLRELLVSVRSASDDMAQARLRLAMEAVFDRACDDLRDVVAGRVVNVGGDLDIAKAVGDAVEEYHVRIKRT